MTGNYHAAIRQAHREDAAGFGIDGKAGDLGISRERQTPLFNRRTVGHAQEAIATVSRQSETDFSLLFHRQMQGGRLRANPAILVGLFHMSRLEQRHNLVQEIEENKQNSHQDTGTASGYACYRGFILELAPLRETGSPTRENRFAHSWLQSIQSKCV